MLDVARRQTGRKSRCFFQNTPARTVAASAIPIGSATPTELPWVKENYCYYFSVREELGESGGEEKR
jgi:hypothetical protein